jgi:tryptophan-rich sensory protein
LKAFFKHPLVIALLSCLIFTPIGSAIYDNTKTIPFITPILKFFSILWTGMVRVLLFKITLLSILVVIISAIAILFLVNKVFYRDNKEAYFNRVQEPKFFEYKQDILKKWLWEWNYKIEGNTYHIIRLRPLCKKDHTPLVNNGNYGLICPRCDTHYGDGLYGNNEYTQFENEDAIITLIQDNIKKRYNNL